MRELIIAADVMRKNLPGGCPREDDMTTITLSEVTSAALRYFSSIRAQSPDDWRKVWDAHRLPAFTTGAGEESRHAYVDVLSLDDAGLQPLRAAIQAAGGERGLEP